MTAPCVVLTCSRPSSNSAPLCLRHGLRRDYLRLRSWARWARQGRPTDVPVVVREGSIIRDHAGRTLIADWHFDTGRLFRPIPTVMLGPWLALRYPHRVQLVERLEPWPAC